MNLHWLSMCVNGGNPNTFLVQTAPMMNTNILDTMNPWKYPLVGEWITSDFGLTSDWLKVWEKGFCKQITKRSKAKRQENTENYLRQSSEERTAKKYFSTYYCQKMQETGWCFFTVNTYKWRYVWSINKIHNWLDGEMAFVNIHWLVRVISFEHQKRRETEAVLSRSVNGQNK